jgi:putative component of membrane protein insertase Oxa1/YidC/SpoIIIJ protein YidD
MGTQRIELLYPIKSYNVYIGPFLGPTCLFSLTVKTFRL